MRTVRAYTFSLLVLSVLVAAGGAFSLAGGMARAAGEPSYQVVLKEHRFQPAQLEVPAGKRILLLVKNEDATPEEIESHDLRVEKIVAGGATIKLRVGPLKPGQYKFYGEYHEDTAQGVLTAK